ncbi:MAG TPA: DUF192 domain-containing protein [Alphaproteobacteria bacterium]|nr:DUF192 domain-containing protein [Alphaproteobacteria bacterium]
MASASPEARGEEARAPFDGPEPLTIETGGAEHRFLVEIARTPEAREQGLMLRFELPSDRGMLFDLGTERPTAMWMKNTLITLDMIFIGSDGTIRKIHSRAEPFSLESVPSGGPVRAVLELPGGTVERLGIEEGDRVRHALFDGLP